MVGSTTNRISYNVTSASTAPLAVDYRFDDSSWLQVRYVETGAETSQLLTIGTHYTVSGDGTAIEGTVTLTSGFLDTITAGELVIARFTPAFQEVNLEYNTRFPAVSVENQMDETVMALQDRTDSDFQAGSRAIYLPPNEPTGNPNTLPLPSFRKGKFFAFDSTTGAIEMLSNEDAAIRILQYYGLTITSEDVLAAISAMAPIERFTPPDTSTLGKFGQLAIIPEHVEIDISGTLTPDITGHLLPWKYENGKLWFSTDGVDPETLTSTPLSVAVGWSGSNFGITPYENGVAPIPAKGWLALNGNSSTYPNDVTSWLNVNTTGQPDITISEVILARVWINVAPTGTVPNWVEMPNNANYASIDGSNITPYAASWRRNLGISDLVYTISTADVTHHILYGQSNSVGSDATPVITTTDVYNHLRFSTGVRALGDGGAGLDGLLETTEGSEGETPCSGFALQWTESLAGVTPTLFMSTSGAGGQPISALVKGSSRYDDFLLPQAENAKSLIDDEGDSYTIGSVVWIHGETDAGAGTPHDVYLEALSGLKSDMQEDFNLITGNTDPLHMVIVQPSANILVSNGAALAQLDLCKVDRYCTYVAPAYAIPHSNNIHYSALGANMAGRFAGRAMKYVQENQAKPPSLIPLGASSNGREIIWRFSIPTPPLLLDSSVTESTISYGFEVEDESGLVPMSSIQAQAGGVRIVAGRDLVGVTEIRYGLDYNGTGIINGASGNLIDSTSDTFWHGGAEYPLPHIAPHAKETVLALRHDAADTITPATPAYETDAFGHWVFGSSSASLTSVVGSEVLTAVGGTPSYGATSVTLPSGHASGLMGLRSDLDDQADQTIIVVVKRPANPTGSNVNHYCGTHNLITPEGGGLMTWALASATTLNINQVGVGNYGAEFTDAINGGAVGSWLMLAYRQSASHFGGFCSSDKSPSLHDIAGGPRSITSNKIGIGNCYTTGGLGNVISMEFAEAVIWDRTLSINEIYAAFSRIRQRQAQRSHFI